MLYPKGPIYRGKKFYCSRFTLYYMRQMCVRFTGNCYFDFILIQFYYLQDCSLFFAKRFCNDCVLTNAEEFPVEIIQVS